MHRQNIHLPERETAHVLREVDEFLKRHAVRRSLVVSREQFLFVVHFVDVLPAPARKRLQDRRPPHIIQQSVPIHWIFQVVERFAVDIHVARITLLRQQNCFWNGNSQLRGNGVIEVFIVGRPPERIVDDVRPLQHRVLQVAAVVFHLMRNAVHDHAVSRRLPHACTAELHEFRGHALLRSHLIDSRNERRRKAVFPPAKKANLFHVCAPVRAL